MHSPERSEVNRNQGDRIGALEQDMAVVKDGLKQLRINHSDNPGRIIRLEQQFEHQSDKLDDLEAGIGKINSAVERMGTKITWAIGVGMAVMFMFEKLWPAVAKGIGV